MYPTIDKRDIKKILQYGWKQFYLFNNAGGDLLVRRQQFTFYVGNLMGNSLRWFNYYKHKMKAKVRIMYRQKRIKWNGYYYFARTENQYQEYLAQKKHRGRPRKKFEFKKVYMYKIYDECNLSAVGAHVYIFRIPLTIDMGFTHYKDKIITDKAELVYERDALKFTDILLSSDNYEFITDNLHKYKRNKDGK